MEIAYPSIFTDFSRPAINIIEEVSYGDYRGFEVPLMVQESDDPTEYIEPTVLCQISELIISDLDKNGQFLFFNLH